MKRIRKEKFLEELFKINRKVIAPKCEQFSIVKNKDEIITKGLLTRISPKSFYFPFEEKLFIWKNQDIKVIEDDAKYILFGLRPCEAKAYKALDKTFDNEIPDNYYIKRRKNTVIISISCNEPLPTCFCTSLGGSPFDKEGSDILLTEKGEFYYTDSYNLDLGFSFEDTDEKIDDLRENAISKIKKYNFEKLKEKLDRIWDTDFFFEITQRCLTCGACTFLCPTCYCFDIEDKERKDGGKRVRIWDACTFKIYTQEASGHNPRLDESKRMRQRVMHKFSYYPELYNIFGCVGCGRCITYCPVNFDIREVLIKAMEK